MKKIVLLSLICLSACTVAPAPPQTASSTQQAIIIMPSATTLPEVMQTMNPPFPRLGMLWPNSYTQPLDQIARYDWVILDDWQADFIEPLHAINPDLLLLTSANASEVAFRPDDPNYNNYLRSIPYEWYLTQVGSSLRADVDAVQTTLPVQDLVIHGEGGAIQLFVPGDTVLIEGESVYIESVNAANRTLIVRRGYIRPASAHKAGTRLAAHISFWPNSWVLNLSTLSPTGIADPAVGPERWGDYNARLDAQSLAGLRWAGIFVDRSGPNASWLIGNSTARTIDLDQSNRLLTDYSAFDEAWNDGLLSYLDQLRAAIGPDQIIYLNWGIPHYAVANGSNFEGIPGEGWSVSWHTQIFGPNETGSYFDWVSRARQPNLTMIETFEDNSRADPNDTDGYFNICDDADFTPNYRKMRFGLTSALLNDGYFSYEMNTQGHGTLCLMWFDEYDNAGLGRGYLGYPLGPAQRLAGPLLPNLLPTHGLDSSEELSEWQTWSDHRYKLSVKSDLNDPADGSGSARIDITQTQGAHWRATFSYAPLPLTRDMEYTLIFYARADLPRTINIWVQRDEEPWDVWLEFGGINLTTEWQKFEITLPSLGEDASARLIFGVGATAGLVWLDEIQFYEGNADIWRRDFDNGVVLVNATAETVTIPLETTYQKINGIQDRSVNDGSHIREVTLPPNDGVILLKSN